MIKEMPENIDMGPSDPTRAGYDQPPPTYDQSNPDYNQAPPAGYSQPQPSPYGQPKQTPYIQPVASSNITVVAQNTVVAPQSYMCLACIVYCFCNWLLGGIAVVLAEASKNAAESGDFAQARRMGRASMWTSIAGIIVSVIVIIVAVVLATTGTFTYDITTSCIDGYDCY